MPLSMSVVSCCWRQLTLVATTTFPLQTTPSSIARLWWNLSRGISSSPSWTVGYFKPDSICSLSSKYRLYRPSSKKLLSLSFLEGEAVATSSSNGSPQVGETNDINFLSNELGPLFIEIHHALDSKIHLLLHHQDSSSLLSMAKYYFDGKGKSIRPLIALALGHAYNVHCGNPSSDIVNKQRKVAIISEMIHTASLIHDDILDKAETRRGNPAINKRWGAKRSTMVGDYILAVASIMLARIRDEDVVSVLSQVLVDLVRGEFQQLNQCGVDPGVADEESGYNEASFQKYLGKTFNKTASLIAYSCKANALLAAGNFSADEKRRNRLAESAFQYGRSVGIAFQLVDDLLDFVATSEHLGKPAAGADLKLGLATAPVLYACSKFPKLEEMAARRFSSPGDVEAALEAVVKSDGLERTRLLAQQHCKEATAALEGITDSAYKQTLLNVTDVVLNRSK